MAEDELIKAGTEVASKGIKQLAPKLLGALSVPFQAWQDRKNLAADVDAIKRLQEHGLVGHYRGLSMELKPYVRARTEEGERLISNTVSTLLNPNPPKEWGLKVC